MKKLRFNPFLETLSGAFGDIVFRQVRGRIIIAHRPDLRGVSRTPAQLAQQERFRQGVAYARGVLADPGLSGPYRQAALQAGRPVLSFLVTDYLLSPVIDALDLSAYTGQPGDKIAVHAHDDFEVIDVRLRLLDQDGSEIENGPAGRQAAGGGHWVYTARTAVMPGSLVCVDATATDRPGNHAGRRALKTIG